MQLSDLLAMVAHEGMRRHAKQAGVMLPLSVGAMLPGIVEKSVERSRSTERQLNDASGRTFKTAAAPSWPFAQPAQPSQGAFDLGNMMRGAAGGLAQGAAGGLASNLGQIASAPAQGIAGGLSDLVRKKLFGEDIGNRKDMTGVAGSAALSTFGKEMGTTGANLLRDIANKAMDALGHAGDDSARKAILGELKQSDPVLAHADDAVLMESYHTMTRFAPTLSTDKNAVRSFLRQAVMSGSGPDFMTIKHLADSERAVTGDAGKDRR